MIDLSVIVLTYNEDIHIARAIRSVAPLAKEIFVVDSFSTDLTADIATREGANVVRHKFTNQAQQFRWALDNLPIETDWVMRLDADEVLTPELITEIEQRLPTFSSEITGVLLNLSYIFMNRKINHGDRSLHQLRIARKNAMQMEHRWMDEHIFVLTGKTLTLQNKIFDHNLKDLGFFIDKHNKYATREAIDVLMKYYNLEADKISLRGVASRDTQARLWLKERVYNRLPFWLGPLGYFIYRYFIRLGFLDGREGLIYHVLQGFWYRFLVAARVFEFHTALKPLAEPQARITELARLTGYSLTDLAPLADHSLVRDGHDYVDQSQRIVF